jgi:hypothetical protein
MAAFESNIRRRFKIGQRLILPLMVLETAIAAGALSAWALRSPRMAYRSRMVENWQSAYRVPAYPGTRTVQRVATGFPHFNPCSRHSAWVELGQKVSAVVRGNQNTGALR